MSGRELTTWVECTVHPSAHEVADIFWAMGDEEQAAFFSRLAEVSGDRLIFQLSYVSQSPELTRDGRRVMEIIGEYSHEVDT